MIKKISLITALMFLNAACIGSVVYTAYNLDVSMCSGNNDQDEEVKIGALAYEKHMQQVELYANKIKLGHYKGKQQELVTSEWLKKIDDGHFSIGSFSDFKSEAGWRTKRLNEKGIYYVLGVCKLLKSNKYSSDCAKETDEKKCRIQIGHGWEKYENEYQHYSTFTFVINDGMPSERHHLYENGEITK